MSPRVALPPFLIGLLVCLAVVSGITGTVTAQQSDIIVEQHGSGVALEDESTTYLWKYSSYSVTVTFPSYSDEIHTVCLSRHDSEETVDDHLVCQWTGVNSSKPNTVTLTQSEWPEQMSGDEMLSIEIYTGRTTSGEPVEEVLLPVHIFEKDGDLAGNGLTNQREIELGTHPAVADTDGDGLTDGIEVMLGSDPRDTTTPYRIAVITIGSLAAGAFGFLLVAGRFIETLQAFGVSTDRTAEEASDVDAEQTFDPPIRDEEQVRQLLSAHDGRLKQSQIVEGTDWSKSKVSRLLSSMEDDDEITRIRLGRENLVCLRGHEPSDISPSWDDGDSTSR